VALALAGLGLVAAGGWRGGPVAGPVRAASAATTSTPQISAAPAVIPGHRLVRLAIDAGALPPGLGTDVTVDLLAAVADSSGGGEVVDVASGRVVAVSPGASPLVTLDVEAVAAPRVLWAEAFAKWVRVLVRASPDDGAPLPDAGGPGR